MLDRSATSRCNPGVSGRDSVIGVLSGWGWLGLGDDDGDYAAAGPVAADPSLSGGRTPGAPQPRRSVLSDTDEGATIQARGHIGIDEEQQATHEGDDCSQTGSSVHQPSPRRLRRMRRTVASDSPVASAISRVVASGWAVM